MKSKIEFTLLFLLGFVLALVLLANDARAQQPAADKDKTQQPAASGQNVSDAPYTITSSIEFGVRGIVIDGNADKYRSDLNYTPGFRIFDSSFLLKSKDNNGPVFDTLMVSSFGWAKDPSKYLRVNAEKTKAYRFDANYRRFDYFNNLYDFALGQHTSNTEYRQGDFNLTILPQNEKIKFNLGYSLDRNSGPSVSTIRYQGDEYAAVTPVRMAADEYRVGVDAKLWVFDLSFMQGWRFFKEDTSSVITVPSPGNNPTNTAAITGFFRGAPTRGETPFTRFSLHTLINKRLDFTGRYVYSSSTTKFSFFQDGTGVDSSGNIVTADVITQSGSAKRPNAMGDLAATLFVTDSFRISETFRVNTFRISGGEILLETLLRTRSTALGGTVLPPVITNSVGFSDINYRRYLNTIEGDFDINRRLSVHAGYRYTDRHIEIGATSATVGAAATSTLGKLDNSTNTFIFGFKAKPVKMWSVYMDLEKGGADNVFTRIDNYEFTNVRLRSILRPTRAFSFNTSLVTKNNTNPSITEDNTSFGVNIKSRIFTTSLDWSPNEKFSFNGGYTYSRLTSDADIIVFLPNRTPIPGQSRYFSRDNFVFLTAYVQLHPRARLFAGYRLHNDPGQGSRTSTIPTLLVGSFPYEMQSPEVKLSFRLHKNVDWIGGYQYFGYEVPIPNTSTQFYHAHLPYTSLRIFFGRE